jgi:pilus assembly protein CpaB
MPSRLRIAVLGALFFGFVAAYGIYNFLGAQRAETEALKRATQSVTVSGRDIPPGTTITDTMVKEGWIKVTPWPKSSVPPGSFSSPQEVVGKVTRVKTVSGEPILGSKLAGEGAGLTVRLMPGYRAMAVKVDEVIGVSGFLVPDDRVDVVVTMVPPGTNSQNEKVSKIVLQSRRVLSVAQSVEQKDGKPQIVRSVTLEVTPEEAEKLSLAALQGEILLALRAVGDGEFIKTRGSTKHDLLAMARRSSTKPLAASSEKPTQAAPEKYRVEVYLGNKRSVYEF